jgi:glycosyltransferase involved in cell wall biosynthesis
VDVHVHSKYSDRPSEWLLRRIGAPESFVEPRVIYDRARARGMQHVTISDHNRILGALEIAHLPGVFLSSELTSYFPEDGAKVHILALDFTEAQFARLDEVRNNIYDLQAYAEDEGIVLSVAHPLFRVNDTLDVDHIEKLLLLFNRFEAINGTRDPRAAELVAAVFRRLSPDLIERLADKHGLSPTGARPWEKSFTGGSDDHGGLYIGSAWTETPPAATVQEFTAHLRAGRHEAGGRSGSSLLLAHSFYEIAAGYYKARLAGENPSGRPALLSELFRRLLEPSADSDAPAPKKTGWFQKLALARQAAQLEPTERALVSEFRSLLDDPGWRGLHRPGGPRADDDQRVFDRACAVGRRLGSGFLETLGKNLLQGRFLESLQSFAALGPVLLSFAPYLAAFRTQHKDEAFLQRFADRFSAARPLRLRSHRKVWITDSLGAVHGVSRTIRTLAAAARRRALPLEVITCEPDQAPLDFEHRAFTPLCEYDLPEYAGLKLAAPPVLEILEHLERTRASEVIISTPGPMGLVGLLAGRLLGLRLTGVYHTDLPQYVAQLTEDAGLGRLAGTFLSWFYGQMDVVLAPSRAYIERLVELGLPRERLQLLPRGVDAEVFAPARRRSDFWSSRGLPRGFTFLYVGRLSAEKNVAAALEAFVELRKRGLEASLAVVGSGPLEGQLRAQYARPDLHFAGWMHGAELAAAYASSDALVFPSTTDTFGNVVLEAQASGLPVIVSRVGGPREIVERNGGGLVVDTERADLLTEAMTLLLTEAERRAELIARGLENAAGSTWDDIFQQLWTVHDRMPPPARSKASDSDDAGAERRTNRLLSELAVAAVLR